MGLWASAACGAPAGSDIQIGQIRYDAEGDDNTNVNDEWVEFVNGAEGSVDLSGWMVKDESGSHRYAFPSDFHLAAGATVRLHTGCGEKTQGELFWCNTGSAIWNNGGDTVFLLDPSGNIALRGRTATDPRGLSGNTLERRCTFASSKVNSGHVLSL